MTETRDLIPMRIMRDKGGLWTPNPLSIETARRLMRLGFADVVDTRSTPRGQYIREKIGLTPAGRAALEADE